MTPAQGYICKGGSRNVKVSIPAPLASKLHDEVRVVMVVCHANQFVML